MIILSSLCVSAGVMCLAGLLTDIHTAIEAKFI